MPTVTRKWVGLASVVAGVVLVLFALSGCAMAPAPAPVQVAQAPTEAPEVAAPTEAPPTEVPPTEVPPTEVPPTDTPEPTETLAPTDTPAPEPTATEAPTEAPAAAPVVSTDPTNCINCHTNQETLQALAVEEEPAESLSEGEG